MLEEFFEAVEQHSKWGSPVEIERRNRIRVALWAYAYEIRDDPIATDAQYDDVCKTIDVSIDTGHKKIDKFFRDHFSEHTGQWIHKHPELNKIAMLYNRLTK